MKTIPGSFRPVIRTRHSIRKAVVLISVLLSAGWLAAQHGGGRHGTSQGPNPAPVGTGPAVTDFERQLAIQATPEQRALYDALSQSLDSAGQRLRNFIRMATGDSRPADYGLQVIGLRDLLEKAGDDSEIFLGSFSPQQKARLKAQSKKLSRAGSELSRLVSILEQESDHPALNHEQLSRLGEDLGKALTSVHGEQLHLGKLMGIPEGPS